jgi:hypothetical protein
VGQYLAVDPVVVRIIFVLLGLYGVGIPLYIVLWLVMPLTPRVHGGDAAPGSNAPHAGTASSSAAYQAFVGGERQRRVHFHPMTGEPVDPELNPEEEIPVRNLGGESSSGDTHIRRNWLLGGLLVAIGVFWMVKMLMPGLLPLLIPGLLIGAGVYVLYRNQDNQQQEPEG